MQLREILFNKLSLKPNKKTKTGEFSTDSQTLQGIVDQHEVVSEILSSINSDIRLEILLLYVFALLQIPYPLVYLAVAISTFRKRNLLRGPNLSLHLSYLIQKSYQTLNN